MCALLASSAALFVMNATCAFAATADAKQTTVQDTTWVLVALTTLDSGKAGTPALHDFKSKSSCREASQEIMGINLATTQGENLHLLCVEK